MATREPATITEAIHKKSDATLRAEIDSAIKAVRGLFGSYSYTVKIPPLNEKDCTPGGMLEAIGGAAFALSSESRRIAAVAAFMAKVEELDAMQRYPEGE